MVQFRTSSEKRAGMPEASEDVPPRDGAHHTVEASLLRSSARASEVVERIQTNSRTDVSGLPMGAAAWLLVNANGHDERTILLTASDDEARALARDLRFFHGTSDADAPPDVLVYPSSDTTPFVDVAPDRRAAMERLAVLFHLAEGLPWRFLVMPAPALLRRVPPKEAILARSSVVAHEEELDRDAFIRLLVEGGYLRVPLVEDAGTFAVRGGIIDVFPPHAQYPARIELDDYLVMSIKLFDADTQRPVRSIDKLFVHPVRDALLGEKEIARARSQIRNLCDAVNVPSSRTAQIIDDIESGRAFFGIEGFLPAFYERLDDLFEYVPNNVRVAVFDPTLVKQEVERELAQAEGDRGSRFSEGEPTFALDAHYLDEGEVAERLSRLPLVLVHRLAVGGRHTEEEASPLSFLEPFDPELVLRLGAEDQSTLSSELKAKRASSAKDQALAPLAQRAREWIDQGLRVFFTARTVTQAERLVSVLRSYDVQVSSKVGPFDPASLKKPSSGRVDVVIGALGHGFVFGSEAMVFVTEEEVFGARVHRRARSSKSGGKAKPFLEDLRQLAVGDYVVHADHGVGRYLGLQRKELPRSRLDEMRGLAAVSVEVLVVEYAGGDKLFLPVTRLNQIQKFSGPEGQKAKLDRLGGQTFAKTKTKVARAVKQLADELLKLYAERRANTRTSIADAGRDYEEFEATFPFEETPDQASAIDEVLKDLASPHPMDRLVCGDVGFGKTEVAVRAAFRVAMGGRQVAMLCPTTVLAQQHFHTFEDRMGDYPVRVSVLSRFVSKQDQTKVLAALKDGTCDVVVGTHRLLSKDVHFKNLGLVVVDEEQRFGVTHKERLKQLRSEVDVLTLSATPIPRTLQMAVGGLRDLSLITTPPVDRRAVRTFVTRWDDHLIREAIHRELSRGGQVFFVYNRIEGLYERAQRLQTLVPDARIAVGHGQMGEAALERVMTDFVEGRYDILCATAIIESGLDIPRANTILIDRADTFGLAQLYQLRGRVGRSRERAYCYLITPPPSQMTDEARARIEALERFTELGSGFQVASLDMELRGAGDLLGAEQSGNVAAVGFDMFIHMLEDAVAQLRGEPIRHDIDPELTFDVAHFLPDDYIDDVGLRLSFYKRFASAEDETTIDDLAAEMEERFGAVPPEAQQYIRAVSIKPALRRLGIVGCEASRERVTFHLREGTRLDPAKVMRVVSMPKSPWRLTPDMKLTKRSLADDTGDSIEHAREALAEIERLASEET